MKNFNPHEFACNCGCGFDKMDASLLQNFDAGGRRVWVESGSNNVFQGLTVGGLT